MEETNFEVGDVVQLKSGGERMTIEKFFYNEFLGTRATDRVHCTWFDNKNVLQRDLFYIYMLSKADF